MENFLRRSLSIALNLAVAIPAHAASPLLDREKVPSLKINVRVYNMAAVPGLVLAQADQFRIPR